MPGGLCPGCECDHWDYCDQCDGVASAIRDHLRQLGIETVPSFDASDFDGQVRFVLIGSELEKDAVNDTMKM